MIAVSQHFRRQISLGLCRLPSRAHGLKHKRGKISP
jgi:hypothetical protein